MNEKVSVANIIKYAGAFVDCAIGSGFATGQEVMQFFSAHGFMSIGGTIVTTVIFAWVGGMFMKHGYEQQLEQPADIIPFYFGKKIGKVFEWAFQIFLYGVYVIMIAGAGATLSEHFGINPTVGRVGMAAIAFVTVILGLTKLTDILGSLGTVIIVFAVGVGIYSFATNPGAVSSATETAASLDIMKTQGGWLGCGILYPAFNAIVVMILASSIGKNANSAKEAKLGGIIGGVLFGASVMALNLGLMAHLTEVAGMAVPTLALASAIHPVFSVIFSVIICCGIYTTTVPMLWGNVRQFAEDGTKKAVIIAAALTGLGLVLGMTDFKVLVNIIYPFSGYMGIILFGFVAWREYGRKFRKPDSLAPIEGDQATGVMEDQARKVS